MAKRLKLKKKVWQIGIPFIFFISIGTYTITKHYNEYKYKQTYEYKFLNHGYTLEDTNKLLDFFKTDEQRKELLEKDKNEKIVEFISEKYYIHKNLEKYLTYAEKNKKKENTEIVAIINTHRDENAYEEIIDSDTTNDVLIIANKYYKLNETFEPLEITDISPKYAYAGNKLAKIALDAYLNLWNTAKEEGYQFIVNTSYRSFSTQEEMYENTKALQGQRMADSLVARPGHSDHQTGLAIDIYELNYQSSQNFQDSPAYTWLCENAYKFGFIERYPKDKENITGFTYEPWHWRYVGEEIAKKIKEENITFDEYYAYYIENQEN